MDTLDGVLIPVENGVIWAARVLLTRNVLESLAMIVMELVVSLIQNEKGVINESLIN